MAPPEGREKLDAWPNISRARLIRFNLIAGSTMLAVVAAYVVLSLATSGAFDWFPVVSLGLLGLLELLGAWSARRDQAREDAAAAGASQQGR